MPLKERVEAFKEDARTKTKISGWVLPRESNSFADEGTWYVIHIPNKTCLQFHFHLNFLLSFLHKAQVYLSPGHWGSNLDMQTFDQFLVSVLSTWGAWFDPG
jgi:hypothetical protein